MEIQKIHSAINAEIGVSKRKTDQVPQAEVATPAQKPASISQDWQLLEKSHLALQQLADVDTDKVNALRASIANGSFTLDLAEIAEKMLKQHG